MHSLFLCVSLIITYYATSISAAPALGVYDGAAPYGPDNIPGYSKWLNQPVLYGTEFEAAESWDHVSGQSWWLQPWGQWVNSAPAGQTRRLVISIPMLPNAPTTDTVAMGATGAFNQYFEKLAQQLVQYKLGSSLLRIGWEFNGNWYRWSATAGTAIWKKFFTNIVQTMKAVPGNDFKVVWNLNNGYAAADALDCYPGDEFVDYVGVDIYDVDWSSYNWNLTRVFGAWNSTQSYTTGDGVESNTAVYEAKKDNKGVRPETDANTWELLADQASLTAKRTAAWNNIYAGFRGLQFWTQFANNHSKPITLNEWGIWAQTHGGFDNAYYIQKMAEYIFSNNVAFYSYFDVYAFDGDHKLQPPTQFPLSSAKFHDLFSKPGYRNRQGN